MKMIKGVWVGAVVLASAGGISRGNLLVNGSFDAGTYTFGGDGATSVLPGDRSITGWTVVSNVVAPISISNVYGVTPEDGTVCLDLQGYSDGSPYGGVLQTIATVPGETYDLDFWAGSQNSISYAVGPVSVQATAGGTTASFTNALTGPGNQWQEFSMDFVASGTSTDITLMGLSTAGGGYIGLDNAVVTVVPEPTSAVLGAGAAGGWVMRRRR
jgi:hypothetical protein